MNLIHPMMLIKDQKSRRHKKAKKIQYPSTVIQDEIFAMGKGGKKAILY